MWLDLLWPEKKDLYKKQGKQSSWLLEGKWPAPTTRLCTADEPGQ